MLELRKHRITIGVVAATAILSAFFLAEGATQLMASWFLPLEAGGVEVAPSRGAGALATGTTGRRQKDPTGILRRNMFDPTTGPVDGSRVAEQTPNPAEMVPPQPADPNAPPGACEGSMRLVGALVNERNPDASFAAITNAAGKVLLYRPGGSVDGRQVVRVYSSRVYLQPSGGPLCQLAMFDEIAPAATAAAPTPSEPIATREPEGPPGAGTGGIPPGELEAGIQAVSDREFNIQRSLVDRLLENQAELMRTARIIPHEEGGRTVGVKLYGIRRNSLLGRLGIQNGDMLRTINGFDMSSPDSALEAYSRLRGADHLTLSVVRRGNAMTLDYNIR